VNAGAQNSFNPMGMRSDQFSIPWTAAPSVCDAFFAEILSSGDGWARLSSLEDTPGSWQDNSVIEVWKIRGAKQPTECTEEEALNLQKVARKYKLNATEGNVGALADVANVEIEPVEKLGLPRMKIQQVF